MHDQYPVIHRICTELCLDNLIDLALTWVPIFHQPPEDAAP
jgi:hypothetical protein